MNNLFGAHPPAREYSGTKHCSKTVVYVHKHINKDWRCYGLYEPKPMCVNLKIFEVLLRPMFISIYNAAHVSYFLKSHYINKI